MNLFPEEKIDHYNEYTAASEVESKSNTDEDIIELWQDVYNKKQQLEESLFNSKDITSDEELKNIRKLTNDLNELSEKLEDRLAYNSFVNTGL